jgi:two-component system sensor kinase FixL
VPYASPELRSLLNAAIDAVIVLDRSGRIEAFSPAAETLFGYGTGEILGRHFTALLPGGRPRRHDARALEQGVRRLMVRGRDLEGRRRDGTVFPAFVSAAKMAGEPIRFVVFIRDLTERRHSERNRELQERLMRMTRLATVGEMAAGVAHELNQPLTAIANYAQAGERLLAAVADAPPDLRSVLQRITSQAVRAAEVIQRLRALVSPPSSRELTDVNLLIEEVGGLIRSDAHAHQVSCRLELGRDLPTIEADRVQLQQVLLNLFHNAVESFGNGRPEGREVVVHSGLAGSELEIRVADNGPGVPETMMPRLFHPFSTTKTGGTGLGLAVSQTIVRAHQGSLTHTPNQPTGAIFCIRLPLASNAPRP